MQKFFFVFKTIYFVADNFNKSLEEARPKYNGYCSACKSNVIGDFFGVKSNGIVSIAIRQPTCKPSF